MHPNPAFRDTDTITALSFASEVGFGTLAINGNDGPLLSHVPFIIDGNAALLHLVRSNPIARETRQPTKAKLAVMEPHSYVSPDWYDLEDQVPTWNYVAVHLTGTLTPLPAAALRGVIDDLSEEFETRLLPKQVWSSAKTDPDVMAKMIRMIQPFRLDIVDVQSTYKLSQNKPDGARLSAAAKMAEHGVGSEIAQLAKMMTTLQSKDPK